MNKKKILVTGSLGYLGSVLTPYLLKQGYDVVGYDTGFFKNCLLTEAHDAQTFTCDARSINESDLEDIDAVVHFAGISNDPFGNLKPEKIYDPTRAYAKRIAQMCKKVNAKFIFASSCSIYGRGTGQLMNETSDVFPQTPYSLNKLQVETDLRELADANFKPICLRFATVFGPSPRMRFDLFINMMVAMAVTTKKVVLNSDGQAWRPSVHIEDIVRAIKTAIEFDGASENPLILNVGTTSENHTVRQVAEWITEAVPGCELKFLGQTKSSAESNQEMELIKDRKIQDGVDTRTYKVSFEKIGQVFSGFKCEWTVKSGIQNLIDWYGSVGLTEVKYKNPQFYRLQTIEKLFSEGRLTDELYWRERDSVSAAPSQK